AQRLTARWEQDPHLTGWTPAGVLDALTQRDHHDHDRLVRGLVAASHEHDEAASVLLLCALRPGLWKLAHTYHRARLSDAFDDLLVNAVHVIARVDPAQDRLYDRILGRVRAATPRLRTEHEEQPVAEFDEFTGPVGEDDIVEQLDAREVLRRLGELRQTGAVNERAWNDLVAVRVHGVPARDIARGRTSRHARADISRFGHRLERLLAA
ncbi:MAG: hypothetical protein AB7V43_13885, partial [Acidimicrobiia bacterium]